MATWLFVHSQFDDAGLDPFEVRAVAGIARRGDCFASVPTLSKQWRMNPKTVRRVLKSITAKRIVSASKRTGQTTVYRLNPLSVWSKSTPAVLVQGLDTPLAELDQTGATVSDQSHPTRFSTDKGNPTEINPTKEIERPKKW